MSREELVDLYITKRLSSSQIAALLGCSMNRVNYWLKKHSIQKRSISDAVYTRRNPLGDPFTAVEVDTLDKSELYGMGIGLYWGEGTKANKYAVRLGNSDPELIKTFMRFLVELYCVEKSSLRFGLQVFSDLDPESSLQYWVDELGVSKEQFYKLHITPSGSIGTYRRKSRHGVVTLYYHNKRLRDILVSALPR